MKTLIIYDSVFGNTQKVAEAMATAFAGSGDVNVINVKDFKNTQLDGLNLLIVGSPTRGFRPTPVLVKALQEIPGGSLNGVKAAAFDTRLDIKKVNNLFLTFMEKIFGYAAAPISKQLKVKGADLIAEPQGFFVAESEGPMTEGEIVRAQTWAKELLLKAV